MKDYAIHNAYASCTSVNIDLEITYKGVDYTWWGHWDSKWQMEEVYQDDNDVDSETRIIICDIAREYLETNHEQSDGTTRCKLDELLDNVIYEG